MKFNKIMLITTILLVFFTIGAISAADNITDEINGVNDDYEQPTIEQNDIKLNDNIESISPSDISESSLLTKNYEDEEKLSYSYTFKMDSITVNKSSSSFKYPIQISTNGFSQQDDLKITIKDPNGKSSTGIYGFYGNTFYLDITPSIVGKYSVDVKITSSISSTSNNPVSYITVVDQDRTISTQINTNTNTLTSSYDDYDSYDYDEYEDYEYYYEDYFTYATLKPIKLTTYWNSGKTFDVKVVDKYDASIPIRNTKVKIYVYTGKNFKTYYAKTNSYGIAKFKLSALSVGTHKVKVYLSDEDVIASGVVSSVKINKAATKITSPTQTVNKGGNFKITVKDSKGKAVKNLILKLKVYTGKKVKIYSVKTNNNGVAIFKTSKLTIGSHKVIITSPSKNYKVSKTSKIIVKKKKASAVKVVNGKYGKTNSFTITVKDGSKTIKVKCTYKKSYKQYLGSVKRYGKTYSVYVAYEHRTGMQHGKIGWWTVGSNGGMSDYAKWDSKHNKYKPITSLKLH